jgi:pseudomonalisin/xanthomonalisin
MTHSLRALPWLLMLASGGAASAASNWVSTATHPSEIFSSDGESLAAAEEVAPGQAVQIAISLKLRNRDLLEQRVAAIRGAGSTDFIGETELDARHLPTQAQVAAVVAHLTANGFRNVEVAPNRLLVTATGSAANVKTAFNTTLHHFGAGAARVFSNTSDAQVPQALSDVVLAVHGLQSGDRLHPLAIRADAVSEDLDPMFTRPPRPVGHLPTDFEGIYGAAALPAATTAVIGIIASGDLTQTLSDFAIFLGNAGFTPFTPTVTYVGTRSSDTSGTPEWDLDSQNSLAAAGGKLKEMVFYVGTSLADAPLIAAFNQAVTENRAKVINISLGGCENSAKTSGFTASSDQIFSLGVSQGQTFSVSTGDSGSKECGRRATGQSYPAVSPYVMAIGGTTVLTTGTNVYKSESAWSGGGGGPSTTEAAPSWQVSSGVLHGGTGRGVPDISFDGDPASGSKIVVNGAIAQYGGTSLSAPLFSGFWSRIRAASTKSLVYPDPSIYKFGPTNPSLFHDVTTGSNGGFTAAAGWDYTTGFGSLNVGNLASFIAATPTW